MKREGKKEKREKLNNKGFSIVELIIVIAIMAILVGVLSPQLIKYLDKSKKAADVQTAQTIATAVNVALANEDAYEKAESQTLSAALIADATNNAFQKELQDILGKASDASKAPKPKYQSKTYTDFFIEINPTDKSFEIYAGTVKPTEEDKQKALILYPTVGTQYK